MKATPNQIETFAIANELYIDLPKEYMTEENLNKRYGIILDSVDGTEDDKDELFYNSDFRSRFGLLGEPWGASADLVIWPRYYHDLFDGKYFKQMIKDAISVKINY